MKLAEVPRDKIPHMLVKVCCDNWKTVNKIREDTRPMGLVGEILFMEKALPILDTIEMIRATLFDAYGCLINYEPSCNMVTSLTFPPDRTVQRDMALLLWLSDPMHSLTGSLDQCSAEMDEYMGPFISALQKEADSDDLLNFAKKVANGEGRLLVRD